jgi:hypothetical protein
VHHEHRDLLYVARLTDRMPVMTRRGHPPDARAIARLRRWYAWSIAGRWSDRALIRAWTLRVPPNVWNLGWSPTEGEIAAYPGRYLIHTDGTAWGPHELVVARADLAARLADGLRFIPDEIGAGAFFFGPPIGELVRRSWTVVALARRSQVWRRWVRTTRTRR